MSELGRQLTFAKERSGLTWRQIADRVGVHPSTLCQVGGGRMSVGLGLAEQLEVALGAQGLRVRLVRAWHADRVEEARRAYEAAQAAAAAAAGAGPVSPRPEVLVLVARYRGLEIEQESMVPVEPRPSAIRRALWLLAESAGTGLLERLEPDGGGNRA